MAEPTGEELNLLSIQDRMNASYEALRAELKALREENERQFSDRETMLTSLAEHLESGDCPKHPLLQAAQRVEANESEITALRAKVEKLEGERDKILACHEMDAGRCFDCRKILDLDFNVCPSESWAKLMGMANRIEKLERACEAVIQYLDNLERNTEPGDPLLAIRQRVHGPLRYQLESALAKAGCNGTL